jgi:hypothetical protein
VCVCACGRVRACVCVRVYVSLWRRSEFACVQREVDREGQLDVRVALRSCIREVLVSNLIQANARPEGDAWIQQRKLSCTAFPNS